MRYGLLVLTLLSGCFTTVEGIVPAQPRLMPSSPLTALDGASKSLPAALTGRPALISLWATWCEGCRREFDPLIRLQQHAAREGGIVVGIAVGEPREKVAAFVAERGLNYPQLVDENFAFADGLGARRVPSTLVINSDGKIVFYGGELDREALAIFRSELGRVQASRQ